MYTWNVSFFSSGGCCVIYQLGWVLVITHMTSLLKGLGITDKKTYHAWLLLNHPDKCGNSEESTRLFQTVSSAYAAQAKKPSPPPKEYNVWQHPDADVWKNPHSAEFRTAMNDLQQTIFTMRTGGC
jgi:hypothetical protein